jgi:Protein of unknown function (DUF1524)
LPDRSVRNYIFFRANRAGLDVTSTYQKYWARFDEEFWREEVKQGRLVKPRSDLFIQHFLASQQGQDIPIKHLYVEYHHWIERNKPFQSITEELAALARNGDYFRRIIAPKPDDVMFDLCSFLEAYDIRTAYPLLLALLDADLDENKWRAISATLESFLLRRAVCNLGTKNYNRIFLQLTKNLRKEGFAAENLRAQLLSLSGDSSIWPDASFREAWLHKPLYGPLNSPKLVHLFGRLNQTFMSNKSERVVFKEAPTIEHIMPQAWQENWPLPDGAKGMDFVELMKASEDDKRAVVTRKREIAAQTLGNLTILSAALNSAQSNMPWKKKLPELMKHSLLPINQGLNDLPGWDEETIVARAQDHFSRAAKVWSR